MVDVDARLTEIAARWSAAQRTADDAEDLEPKGPTVMQMYWRALEDVPWLLAVLKEQAGQIERLQRETNGTFVSVEARALGLLRAIAEEAESLNHHLAVHGPRACNGVRTRVQNIHGLAVTPEVEEWHAERSDEVASTASSASEASRLLTERDAEMPPWRASYFWMRGQRDKAVAALVARDAELAKLHEDAAFTAAEVERVANAAVDAWQSRAEALEAEVAQLRAERDAEQMRAFEMERRYLAERERTDPLRAALTTAERLAHDRGEAAKDAIRIVEECPTDAGEGFYIEALLAVRDRLAGVVPPEQAPRKADSGGDKVASSGGGA